MTGMYEKSDKPVIMIMPVGSILGRKASAVVSGPLVFDGNVLVTHQATVRSDASFSIEASGNITVEMGSTLQAKGQNAQNVPRHAQKTDYLRWVLRARLSFAAPSP